MMDPTTTRGISTGNAQCIRETTPDSPEGGGGDEVDKDKDEGVEDKQEQGEVTPPKDPLMETDTSKKRKVSPQKPSVRKNSRSNNPHL
jgi:hypothetical protein